MIGRAPSLDLFTCDLDQHSCALYPGSRVIIAVPSPAAVIPTLLRAELGQDEGSSLVSYGIVRQDRLHMGALICLRCKDRVVYKPGDVRESSSVDMTAQPGCSQFGVSCVEIIHLYYDITSDWDWTNRGTQ